MGNSGEIKVTIKIWTRSTNSKYHSKNTHVISACYLLVDSRLLVLINMAVLPQYKRNRTVYDKQSIMITEKTHK